MLLILTCLELKFQLAVGSKMRLKETKTAAGKTGNEHEAVSQKGFEV
jgi:hypothetical protein